MPTFKPKDQRPQSVFRMLRFVLMSMFMMVVAVGCAFAESTVDSLGMVGNVQCDAFKKNPGGSWTAIRQSVVTIGPDRLSVGRGMTFEKKVTSTKRGGVILSRFVGPNDLTDVLDKTCSSARI